MSFYTFLTGSSSFEVQYITCLYWAAATSASVGYGDARAHTTTEVNSTVNPFTYFATSKMKENLCPSLDSSSQFEYTAKQIAIATRPVTIATSAYGSEYAYNSFGRGLPYTKRSVVVIGNFEKSPLSIRSSPDARATCGWRNNPSSRLLSHSHARTVFEEKR